MSATLRPGFFFIYSPIDGPIWSGLALLAGPVPRYLRPKASPASGRAPLWRWSQADVQSAVTVMLVHARLADGVGRGRSEFNCTGYDAGPYKP